MKQGNNTGHELLTCASRLAPYCPVIVEKNFEGELHSVLQPETLNRINNDLFNEV